MAGVHGERMYGYVDRVPGLCYVATQFFHFNFVPLFPLGTYLVMEGSDPKLGLQARRIGMSLKSVLLGFFRGWVGLATIVLFAIIAFQAADVVLDGAGNGPLVFLVYGIAAVAYAAVWWAMLGTHRSWILAWVVVLAASGGYFAWDLADPPPPKPDNPFKAPMPKRQRERDELPTLFLLANGCLFALSVLRTFDRAGRGRACELGELLGIEEATMDEIWHKVQGRIEDSPPQEFP